jgi:hypothetical protein
MYHNNRCKLQNALEMMIFIATRIEVLSDIVNDITKCFKNASSNLWRNWCNNNFAAQFLRNTVPQIYIEITMN